jgi:adenylate kinase family enzyme
MRVARSLVKQFDIAFVSTGDVLRKEIMAKSRVGRKAEAVVASGGERLRLRPRCSC